MTPAMAALPECIHLHAIVPKPFRIEMIAYKLVHNAKLPILGRKSEMRIMSKKRTLSRH